ncbi:AAA domain-containing protein [Niveispirillum sp. SYP-B3756]|uniref:AAA family ATPase n=1 Tax=Niveispirillum sp. SYP-B3756 TaxID=2662178 RepID=UPI0012926686|nr:AAA family ATPase [Niveispirillum sp. SYP-B3756]MQP66190.1 AAA domain-containing protein [Niveispirillum sp. SYP-B3756]
MLGPDSLKSLVANHKNTLKLLLSVESLLKARFIGMDVHVRALILAVACGEPLLLVGPPGTAKSRLIRAFCGAIGVLDENDAASRHDSYFEYLLTPFTEPGELFGHYDIAALHERRGMIRLEEGMMQNAKVVFLDEIFNASSAILNSILSFMNERVFHDRGSVRPVAMHCMFAATNDVPRGGELRAIYDRFVIRSWVENVRDTPEEIGDLIQRGWLETYGTHQTPNLTSLLDKLADLRREIRGLTRADTIKRDNQTLLGNLSHLVKTARQYNASAVSNRRLVKFSYMMTMHRLLRAVEEGAETDKPLTIGRPELALFWKHLLDSVDPMVIQKMEKLPYPVE